MSTIKIYLSAFCMTISLLLPTTMKAVAPPNIEWTRQLGTAELDISHGVSVDNLGNVFIAGTSRGDIQGVGSGLGNDDIFVSLYDSTGAFKWTRQMGTIGIDRNYGVSADGLGNVYISGEIRGAVPSTTGSPIYFSDVVFSKYNSLGALQWTKQLGDAEAELSRDITADAAGNVYVTGYTKDALFGTHAGDTDAFLIKYDSVGNEVWTKQLGTTALDISYGVTTDSSGNVYIVGETIGVLGASSAGDRDAFVVKYNSSGVEQWTTQLGTAAEDRGFGITVDDSQNVYITGWTEGDLDGANAGGIDSFVSKLNSLGAEQWTKQLGTTETDILWGIDIDGSGNVITTGSTAGDIGGVNAGGHDIFIRSYDSTNGDIIWTKQFGSDQNDFIRDVAVDSSDAIYISGYTEGVMGAANFGGRDAFVTKLVPVPEPSSLLLAALGLIGVIAFGNRRRTIQ